MLGKHRRLIVQKYKKTVRNGFTLVELSIVLVIIGLLIGGILAAQSMIKTAKINAVAMQIGQFDASVENFKTKYNNLPGDAPAFGGDGNGLIDRSTYNQNAVNVFQDEIANFWANLFPQTYQGQQVPATGAKAVYIGPNVNVPLSKLGSTNAFFIASALSTDGDGQFDNVDSAHNSVAGSNYYSILDGTQCQTPPYDTLYRYTQTDSTNSSVKPADLLALDKKIDDGIANTGYVLSGWIGGGYGGAIRTDTPLATCSQGATYKVQNNSYECTPLIRMGSSAGDPQ